VESLSVYNGESLKKKKRQGYVCEREFRKSSGGKGDAKKGQRGVMSIQGVSRLEGIKRKGRVGKNSMMRRREMGLFE